MIDTFPLAGVKVLDFSRVVAGPFSTRILSDLGADVIKVEPPEGDLSRVLGRNINGLSGMFTQHNVGKRSVCVDLGEDGAAELMLALAAQADVVVENFRPGIMSNLGLGWEALSSVNPQLIMLSISGFGQVGPERDRAAYAPIVHAETGLLQRQQYLDKTERPTGIGLSVADTVTGLHGTIALLAALGYAQRTGTGQQIDMAMINAMFFTDDYASTAIDGIEPFDGAGLILKATGGPIMLAGDEKWLWRVLNTKGGVEDPTPPDADLHTKITLRREAIEAWLLSFADRQTLVERLDQLKLAWGEVLDHKEVFERQGSVKAREVLISVDDRGGGQRQVTNTPYRFSNADAAVRAPAPHRGEHNFDAITDWLGADTPDLEALHHDGVLLQDDSARDLTQQ
ncbi:MAG: CaiB/BaiF CoA transferase family protein [Acidimicrobiales bacterium]|jgi:CoA:oxalate CoA-transferase